MTAESGVILPSNLLERDERDALVAVDKIADRLEVDRGGKDLPTKFGLRLGLASVETDPPQGESGSSVEGIQGSVVDFYGHCFLNSGPCQRKERVDVDWFALASRTSL